MAKEISAEMIIQALIDPRVGHQLTEMIGDTKGAASAPAKATASLLMSNLYDQKIEARNKQRQIASFHQSLMESQLGAGTASGGMNYLTMMGGALTGSDYMMSTPYSTQSFNRELAKVELRRRGSEMVGQTAYEALNTYTMGASGAIGRRLGVESAIYNAAETERGMERLSRGLGVDLTGKQTSALGFGFKAGSMREASREISIREGALQREFGYSAKQLQQAREGAMQSLDASTVSDLVRTGGKDKLSGAVSAMQSQLLSYSRELNVGAKEAKDFFRQLTSFGADIVKESESAKRMIVQGRKSVGNVSAAEYMGFYTESYATAQQQYLGGRDFAVANVDRMMEIGRNVKGGRVMGSAYREVLGRYGGDSAQGHANLARTIAEGGFGFMQSGLGNMTRMAMMTNKGGPLGTGLANLMGLAGKGIGSNPLLALEAQVNEGVRGAVASNGVEYAMQIAEQNPIMAMANTESQRNALKAKLVSQFTGRSINEAHDLVKLRAAENKVLKSSYDGSNLGNAGMGIKEYSKKIRAYAKRGGMSVEAAGNAVNKKMGAGKDPSKDPDFNEITSGDADFDAEMESGMASAAESSSLTASTTEEGKTELLKGNFIVRNLYKAERAITDSVSTAYYWTKEKTAQALGADTYSQRQKDYRDQTTLQRKREQQFRAKADRYRTLDKTFTDRYKTQSASVKQILAKGQTKAGDRDAKEFSIQELLNVDEGQFKKDTLKNLDAKLAKQGVGDTERKELSALIHVFGIKDNKLVLDQKSTKTQRITALGVMGIQGKRATEIADNQEAFSKYMLSRKDDTVVKRTLSRIVRTKAETRGHSSNNPLYVISKVDEELWNKGATK